MNKKKLKKILTAEEFLDPNWCDGDQFDREKVCKHMIEFAKLHVKEALKAADNNAEVIVVDYENDFGFIKSPKPIWGVCSDSILNAYHLDLIK
jgi:hypothetical protein